MAHANSNPVHPHLFGVFQEAVGGDELQGIVTTPEAAVSWVKKLIELYGLTHFDEVQEVPEDPPTRIWEGKHATWVIRELPILTEVPVLEPMPWEATAVRLLQKADAEVDLGKLPEPLRHLAQLEIDTCGQEQIAMGYDEELGWFLLHRDEELVYVVDVEREIVE